MLVKAGVWEGDMVLVTGASGGVGSALLQLAKRRGATMVGMAGRAKQDALARCGADALIERAADDLAVALRGAIGREEVTVVADVVGGPGFPDLLERLARGGRYVTSGAIAGPLVDLDLGTLCLNDLSMLGSMVIPLHVFPDLVSHIERGEVRPMLARTWPLEKLREAQIAFTENAHVGSMVVIP